VGAAPHRLLTFLQRGCRATGRRNDGSTAMYAAREAVIGQRCGGVAPSFNVPSLASPAGVTYAIKY
jgi:hypothetical protein